jgi:hypothetical protein
MWLSARFYAQCRLWRHIKSFFNSFEQRLLAFLKVGKIACHMTYQLPPYDVSSPSTVGAESKRCSWCGSFSTRGIHAISSGVFDYGKSVGATTMYRISKCAQLKNKFHGEIKKKNFWPRQELGSKEKINFFTKSLRKMYCISLKRAFQYELNDVRTNSAAFGRAESSRDRRTRRLGRDFGSFRQRRVVESVGNDPRGARPFIDCYSTRFQDWRKKTAILPESGPFFGQVKGTFSG